MRERAVFADTFYIDDHAVLFALLIRQAEFLGSQGKDAAARGVVLYGKERGLRMAMRCAADGRPLTLRNYLNYGEWADDRGWSDFRPAGLQPFVLEALKCGWCDSWKKYGLEEYGRVYCRWIDPSLVKGFNPEAEFSMGETLSRGEEKCRFFFHGASFADAEDLKKDVVERAAARPYRIKDFLYHTGHALSAMRRNFMMELGLIRARRLVEVALAEYAALFGREKADILIEESAQDYLRID
ncbi:MAG: L-2-amino-thiazoline-4-carboxylic acid hydrolase [Desulfovibrio sp.]|jgi:hypothetical protein|nr:L-2-amino-thiazoline-4-carboxylic acid hydrolase [Desulfovibrio sp.]